MAVAHPISSAIDEQVLDIVAGLVNELSGGSAQAPSLQDSLDRDLGISSLEGVELLANHASYIDPIVLEAEDRHKVYFQKASVLKDGFDRLSVGSAVSFVEEPGEKGPQASTVKLLHPRRIHRSFHTAPGARVVR